MATGNCDTSWLQVIRGLRLPLLAQFDLLIAGRGEARGRSHGILQLDGLPFGMLLKMLRELHLDVGVQKAVLGIENAT